MCERDERHVLSAGSDGMLVCWDIEGKDGTLLAQVPDPFYCCSYDSEQDTVFAGSRSGTLYVLDVGKKQLLLEKKIIAKAIFDVLPLQSEIWLALENGDLLILDRKTGEQKKVLRISEKNLRRLTRIEHQVLISSSDGCIYNIDIESYSVKEKRQVSDMSVFATIPYRDTLLTSGRDARIHQWLGDRELKDVNAHWYSINDLKLSPDGNFIASCSMDKSIKIWDAQTLELLKVIDRERLDGHTSSVNRLVWLNDYELISCSDDRSIQHFMISGIN